MDILTLSDSYFLVLMLIQGTIVAFYDAASFKRKNAERAGKKAKVIGITLMAISIILYIARWLT